MNDSAISDRSLFRGPEPLHHGWIIAACAFLTACIVAFHLANGTTLYSRSDEFLSPGLRTMLTKAPYLYRPIYPRIMSLLTGDLQSNVALAYGCVQAVGTFFFLWSISRLGGILGGARNALATAVLAALSYPILFASFEPIYSHDDMFQYGFASLAIASWVKGDHLRMAVFFMIATMFREATLFLFPGLVLASAALSLRSKDGSLRPLLRNDSLKVCAWLLLPTFTHIALLAYHGFAAYPGRYEHWKFNLAGARMADTLFSSAAAYLPGILLIARTQEEKVEDAYASPLAKLRLAGVLSLPVFVLVVLIATQARETRIFFPPLLLLLPLAAMNFRRLLANRGFIFALCAVAAIAFSIAASRYFPPFEFRPAGRWHWAYLLAVVILVYLLNLSKVLSRVLGSPLGNSDHEDQHTLITPPHSDVPLPGGS